MKKIAKPPTLTHTIKLITCVYISYSVKKIREGDLLFIDLEDSPKDTKD